MSLEPDDRALTVALIGNPNTGKSTLFNALAGVRQRVGNYPGVTVEKKIGRASFHGQVFSIVDLPGTYSLAPRSPDEMIAVEVLLGRREDVEAVDAVLCIVDASNLERNLYLVSQVLELGLPTVIALNMTDVAHEKGIKIDVLRLRERLQLPVVEIQANRKIGLESLKTAISEASDAPVPERESPFPEVFQQEVRKIAELEQKSGEPVLPRYLIERLLLDTGGYLEKAGYPGVNQTILEELKTARERLTEAGSTVPGVEAICRYQWVGEILNGVIERRENRKISLSDRLDRLLTHKYYGVIFFILLMVVIFQAVFLVADPASSAIDYLMGFAGIFVEASFTEDTALRSFLLNGVIAGVGGVLVFLPQIFTLFFFIAVLEDCGYMSRAAFLMDRLMSSIGLSGKSFIPLLSSFACAIPGIMAARVVENPRDRLVTILVAPLMSCSARLPVYTLLIGAFISKEGFLGGWLGWRGLTMFAMYSIGVVTAIFVALVLKKTILKGATPPFVMELPSYKIPALGVVLHRMFDRGWAFVRRAGTLILAMTVLVWAAAYYPRDAANLNPALVAAETDLTQQIESLQQQLTAASPQSEQAELQQLEQQLHLVENEIQGDYLRQSWLGQAGQAVEPAVKPLGWDWRIGCAVIASFPAREVVVATLGVIYNLGEDESEIERSLATTLENAKWEGTDRAVFNTPVALSVMVFFALCAQCVSTLVVIRRETNSWKWPIFTFVYMTTLAYLGSLATYQIGMLFIS